MALGSPERMRDWIPRWWRGEGGAVGSVLDALLLPAEHGYGAVVRARNLAYDRGWLASEEPPIPLVSVGNLGVGGAGKTPFAAWVAGRLQEWEVRPAVVLRGYGADEVLVHRELNPGMPVFTGARRMEAVRAAAEAGCGAAVLDDAFQHRALRRALDLVLISADAWGERRRLLPRGPWREGLGSLRRADAAVVTRKAVGPEAADRVVDTLRHRHPELAVVRCAIQPTTLVPLHAGSGTSLSRLDGKQVLAVASLADPGPFARNLEQMGARVELAAFPDHHPFGADEAAGLLARAAGRTLVTTRKEAVKLRPLLPPGVHALVLDQRVQMEQGGDRLDQLLRTAVGR